MKKVGIITFHRANNYGAVLQAFALQTIIQEQFGYDTNIIDYYNRYLYGQYEVFRPTSHNPLKTMKHFVGDIIGYRQNSLRYHNYQDFIAAYLTLTPEINDVAKLADLDLDYYITGSDQVWNRNLTDGLDDCFALNFESKAKKISYAASLGSQSVLEGHESEFAQKLRWLDSISTREEYGREALSQIVNKPIDVVSDPTILLTSERWEKIISTVSNDEKVPSNNYIFTYCVGHGSSLYYETIRTLSTECRLKVIHFEKNNFCHNYPIGAISQYGVSPLVFLNKLLHSKYVITSSFHGLVFSILFHKKALIVPCNKPERLMSLIKKTNIGYYTIDKRADLHNLKAKIEAKIDWKNVDKKLFELRNYSLNWLAEALSGEER